MPRRTPLARFFAASFVALTVVACAQRATPAASPQSSASDEPPLACVRSDTGMHVLAKAAGGGNGRVDGIVRGTDHELIRNASVITLQPIGGGTPFRARADTSGRFSIPNVANGRYELRIVSIGYQTSRDTINVSHDGLSLQLTQVIMRFLDEEVLCGYLAAIDSEPMLLLPKSQTIAETHALPNGGSVQTTLIARPNPDGASFEVVFRNVGTAPVTITRLCYPSITASPVRKRPAAVGPSCYGVGTTLAAGDTIGARETVQLRGKPGTFTFRFHAVDPPVLDAVFPLRLTGGRGPRAGTGQGER